MTSRSLLRVECLHTGSARRVACFQFMPSRDLSGSMSGPRIPHPPYTNFPPVPQVPSKIALSPLHCTRMERFFGFFLMASPLFRSFFLFSFQGESRNGTLIVTEFFFFPGVFSSPRRCAPFPVRTASPVFFSVPALPSLPPSLESDFLFFSRRVVPSVPA